VVDLGHADQAGIREAHRHVGILVFQAKYGVYVVCEAVVADNSTSTKQRCKTPCALHSEQIEALGNHGLARDPGGRKSERLVDGPGVIAVAITKESDKIAGVNDYAWCHSP